MNLEEFNNLKEFIESEDVGFKVTVERCIDKDAFEIRIVKLTNESVDTYSLFKIEIKQTR